MAKHPQADLPPGVHLLTYAEIGQDHGDPPAIVVVQIGERDDLTAERATAAGEVIIAASNRYPNALIKLTMDGFDDTTCELWDIPEAKTYVARVGQAMVKHAPDHPRVNLDQDSVALIGLCVGFMRISAYDPKTGDYTVEVKPGLW